MVLAAGAWTGSLLGNTTGDARWRDVFKPRRGHLLELDSPAKMPQLRHGLMEMGYTQVSQVSGNIVNTLHLTCKLLQRLILWACSNGGQGGLLPLPSFTMHKYAAFLFERQALIIHCYIHAAGKKHIELYVNVFLLLCLLDVYAICLGDQLCA